MASVYVINKGVNRPIEFQGLRAQYIAYLAIGLVVLLVLFVVTYLMGFNPVLCVMLVLVLGIFLFSWVFRMSRIYGRYGMMKRAAARKLPSCLRFNSRNLFLYLNLAGRSTGTLKKQVIPTLNLNNDKSN